MTRVLPTTTKAVYEHVTTDSLTSFQMHENDAQISPPAHEEAFVENVNEAAVEAEGCTLGSVALALLRFTVGLVGVPLYGISFLVGCLPTFAIIIPALIAGLPFALLGAGMGAAFVEDSPDLSGMVKGMVVGELFPLALAEVTTYLPKAIICFTVGYAGAGLTAFALDLKFDELCDLLKSANFIFAEVLMEDEENNLETKG
jgi:hypothetical protein